MPHRDAMSAGRPTTDIRADIIDVCYVPAATICAAANFPTDDPHARNTHPEISRVCDEFDLGIGSKNIALYVCDPDMNGYV